MMYLAKKYILPQLEEACLKDISRQMRSSMDDLLSLYKLGLEYDCEKVVTEAAKLIQKDATKVLKSDKFSTMAREIIDLILDMQVLNTDEYDLFEACLRWARATARSQGRGESPDTLREVLGELLYKIRFPTMTLKQVGKVKATGLLSLAEALEVFEYLAREELHDLPESQWCFPTQPRLSSYKITPHFFHSVNDRKSVQRSFTLNSKFSVGKPCALLGLCVEISEIHVNVDDMQAHCEVRDIDSKSIHLMYIHREENFLWFYFPQSVLLVPNERYTNTLSLSCYLGAQSRLYDPEAPPPLTLKKGAASSIGNFSFYNPATEMARLVQKFAYCPAPISRDICHFNIIPNTIFDKNSIIPEDGFAKVSKLLSEACHR